MTNNIIDWFGTNSQPFFLTAFGNYIYASIFDGSIAEIIQINLKTANLDTFWVLNDIAYGLVIREEYLYASTNSYGGGIAQIKYGEPFSPSNPPTTNWATITTGSPRGLAVFGNYMYVACVDVSPGPDVISKIELNNPTNIVASWATGFDAPEGLVIDADGEYMYVANNASGTISKVDVSTGAIVKLDWCLLNLVYGLAIYGPYMYASTNSIESTIIQINLKDGSINNSNWFDGLSSPQGLCAFDSFLYVANGGNQTISKLELPPTPPTPPTPISNICFPAKTPITTDQGNIPIECVDPDIHTIDNKKIVAITKTISLDEYLICIEKDAIDFNYPNKTTLISKDHKVFYEGEMFRAEEFAEEFEDVYRIEYNGEILYNVLMEEHDNMRVNNLICETLHPKNIIAKLYSKHLDEEYKNKFITLLNNFFTATDSNDELRSEHDISEQIESLDEENYNNLVKYLNQEITKIISNKTQPETICLDLRKEDEEIQNIILTYSTNDNTKLLSKLAKRKNDTTRNIESKIMAKISMHDETTNLALISKIAKKASKVVICNEDEIKKKKQFLELEKNRDKRFDEILRQYKKAISKSRTQKKTIFSEQEKLKTKGATQKQRNY